MLAEKLSTYHQKAAIILATNTATTTYALLVPSAQQTINSPSSMVTHTLGKMVLPSAIGARSIVISERRILKKATIGAIGASMTYVAAASHIQDHEY